LANSQVIADFVLLKLAGERQNFNPENKGPQKTIPQKSQAIQNGADKQLSLKFKDRY
jgi:hypothetical protein